MSYEVTPTGHRRSVGFGTEGFSNATLQGSNAFFPPLKRSILVHEIYNILSVSPRPAALPASNTEIQVLGLIMWFQGPATKADQGAPSFFPQFPEDPSFGTYQASDTQGDGSLGVQNLSVGNRSANSLWHAIVKAWLTNTGPAGGASWSDSHATHPEQIIPEGSVIVLHADEVTDIACQLDIEFQATMSYTPIKTEDWFKVKR